MSNRRGSPGPSLIGPIDKPQILSETVQPVLLFQLGTGCDPAGRNDVFAIPAVAA